jgi:hypothetical protein
VETSKIKFAKANEQNKVPGRGYLGEVKLPYNLGSSVESVGHAVLFLTRMDADVRLLHKKTVFMVLRYPDTRNLGLFRGETALISSAPQAPSPSLVTERNGCEKIVLSA